MEIIERFLEDPQESFFLFGPRGTGKSTWIQLHHPGALCVDLLAPEVFRAYSARPERLRELVLGNPAQRLIVVDEIQKVPALLDVIHGLMEEDRRRQFIMTGSSARKLKRTGVDLLAGRALLRTLHPFMAAELGDAFRLEEALTLGLLPVVLNARNPRDVLSAYVSLYLREEVQLEGLVRNVGNFSRFLEAVSFSHAATLNISNVARECEVGRKTMEGYVGILEDLLLAFRLQVFTRRAQRAVSRHPRFYLFDAGVYRSLRPAGPLDRPEEIEGRTLEGLVAQHLRAWNAYAGERYRLYFWQTPSGTEVDFVVYGPDGFWALEVKNSARVRPEDLRSLKAFRKAYPECRALLLYRGEEHLRRDDILCLPCAEFLRQLRPGEPLDAGL